MIWYVFLPLPPAPHSLNQTIWLLQSSWAWQYFFQLRYCQVADPNNLVNIETTYSSLALAQALCDQRIAYTNPRRPNIRVINKYGGWDVSPSNVFFTNGERWSLISLYSCFPFSDRIAA